jgi:hypothetical protein
MLVSEFHRNATKDDGRSAKCKGCVRLYGAAWRRKNPEKQKAYQSARRGKKRPGGTQYMRLWYRSNREKWRAYLKARYWARKTSAGVGGEKTGSEKEA